MTWTITPKLSFAYSQEDRRNVARKILLVLTSNHPEAARAAGNVVRDMDPVITVYTRDQVTAVCRCLHYYGVGYSIHEITRVDVDEFPVGHRMVMAPV